MQFTPYRHPVSRALVAFAIALLSLSAAAAPPTARFDFDLNGRTLTLGNFSSDSDGSIVSHRWNFGDGNYSDANAPVHTYASNGSYSISLTVTDNDGESATATTAFPVRVNVCDKVILENGSIVNDIRLRQDFCPPIYELEVPYGASDLVIRFDRGPGAIAAAGMSVRFGAPPWSGAFDCRIGGNQDPPVCVIPAPIAGTYYIRVETAGDIYEGRLAARFDHPDMPNPPQNLAVTSNRISPILRRTVLTWEKGADLVTVSHRRNLLLAMTNWGTWTGIDFIWNKPTTTIYKVCNAGTTLCSDETSISYP